MFGDGGFEPELHRPGLREVHDVVDVVPFVVVEHDAPEPVGTVVLEVGPEALEQPPGLLGVTRAVVDREVAERRGGGVRHDGEFRRRHPVAQDPELTGLRKFPRPGTAG